MITQVAWHKYPTFLAKIEFRTEEDWVNDLDLFVKDMKDLGRTPVQRSPELLTALNKVNAPVSLKSMQDILTIPLTLASAVLRRLPGTQGSGSCRYKEHFVGNEFCT